MKHFRYSLGKRWHDELERSNMLLGKITFFRLGHFQYRKLLVHKRICHIIIPWNPMKPPSSNMIFQHGFPTWFSNMVFQHGFPTWISNMDLQNGFPSEFSRGFTWFHTVSHQDSKVHREPSEFQIALESLGVHRDIVTEVVGPMGQCFGVEVNAKLVGWELQS